MSWIKGQVVWIRRGKETGLTLAVRRKIGTAVVRNRLKRRLRSIFTGLDPRPDSLVVFPQQTARTASFKQLADELKDLITRL